MALCFGPDVRTLDTVNGTSGLVRWDLAAGAVAATSPNVRAASSQRVRPRLTAAPLRALRRVAGQAASPPSARSRARRRRPLVKRPALSRHGSVCLDVRFDAGWLLVLWASPDCVRRRARRRQASARAATR